MTTDPQSAPAPTSAPQDHLLRAMIDDGIVTSAPQAAGVERMRVALERIERWFGEFPPTGREWKDGTPMSYAACYGSNGERDYMRQIAREGLAAAPQAEGAGAPPMPKESVTMPACWSVAVEAGGETLLSIGHDWVSGLPGFDERIVVGACQHLLAFIGYGLPLSSFAPDEESPAPQPAAAPGDALPLNDWHEGDGAVLWWRFPIDEAPYVGSPLCDSWPGYHTHWTPLIIPARAAISKEAE